MYYFKKKVFVFHSRDTEHKFFVIRGDESLLFAKKPFLIFSLRELKLNKLKIKKCILFLFNLYLFKLYGDMA